MNDPILWLNRIRHFFLAQKRAAILLALTVVLTGVPTPAQAASASAPRAFQVQIGRLVLKNFDLVKALAADDPAAAGQAASQFDELLRAVDPAPLASGAQRGEWERLSKTLRETARRMAAGADLKEKRLHFKPFSDALIEVVEAFGVAEAGTVHRVMCPMVAGGKGFWLQPQKAITNPYFGARMLTCGVILETFPKTAGLRGGSR